jgi:hypothetical protein
MKVTKLKMDEQRLKRFWDKVDIKGEDECWLWLASANSRGYGCFAYEKDSIQSAHKMSWAMAKNKNKMSDPSMHVMHTCDVKRCVNPKHLELGTPKQNQNDAIKRGIARSIGEIVGKPSEKKLCKNGHTRSPENTTYRSYPDRNGVKRTYPLCKTCHLQQHREHVARIPKEVKAAYQRAYRARRKANTPTPTTLSPLTLVPPLTERAPGKSGFDTRQKQKAASTIRKGGKTASPKE